MPQPKILIVEDEALTALLLKQSLHLLGYPVCPPVSSGEAAIQVAQTERPDLILMDIRLAGEIDGLKAAQVISAIYATKIVFMSGYSDDEMIAQAQASNAAAYLVKPVTPDDVTTVIAALFGQNLPD